MPLALSVTFSLTPRSFVGSILPWPNFFSTASRPDSQKTLAWLVELDWRVYLRDFAVVQDCGRSARVWDKWWRRRGKGIEKFVVTDLYRDNPPDQHCLVLVVGFGSGPFSQISFSEVMSLSNNDDSRDDLIIGGIFDKDSAGEDGLRNVNVLPWRGQALAASAAPPRPTLCASCQERFRFDRMRLSGPIANVIYHLVVILKRGGIAPQQT